VAGRIFESWEGLDDEMMGWRKMESLERHCIDRLEHVVVM